MRSAEKHNLMAPEQYGSRKNKVVGTQCLNKRLFYNLHWFQRRPDALCLNGAKSCYDRIVLIIAVLSLCRLGAMTASVQSMVDMLANLHHHIRTAFGNLEQNQGQAEWDKPTAGIGQGNGTGPQIWAVVSLPLFNIMRQEGLVANFICMLSKEQRALAGFAFVNDTDLIVNNYCNNTKQVHQ